MLPGRTARAWGACSAVALLAFFTLGASALAGNLPKPDPPPKANPPPPPAPPPPAPVEPQPVAPPPVATAPVTPVVVHPTAAERAAAAAAHRAKLRAARVERARRAAARKRLAAAGAKVRVSSKRRLAVPVAQASQSPSALPYLIVAFGAALAMLGLALTPARAVPWSRASRLLHERRDELGVLGAMGLVATVLFFLLVQVTT